MVAPLPAFHLAIPVHDLAAARAFYGDVLGCSEGRSTDEWVDFNFYGHQLVCHLSAGQAADDESARQVTNRVDAHDVPIPHFGIVLDRPGWDVLVERLKTAGIRFLLEPTVRFQGQAGEQATLFCTDPSGNALEFKSLRDPAQLFTRDG